MSEQKPVAWMDDFGNVFPLGANKGAASWMDDHKRNWKPLFLAAPPAQPAQAQPARLSDGDIEQALRRAYYLGQTYWQQADSEFTSEHRKADATSAKFNALIAETIAAAQKEQP